MNEPIYENGLPQNLEAAALDALEWMRWMRVQERLMLRSELKRRLDRAIAALELFTGAPANALPHTGQPAAEVTG